MAVVHLCQLVFDAIERHQGQATGVDANELFCLILFHVSNVIEVSDNQPCKECNDIKPYGRFAFNDFFQAVFIFSLR